MIRSQGAPRAHGLRLLSGGLSLIALLLRAGAAPTSLDAPIVVTQVPRANRGIATATPSTPTARDAVFEGARLVVVSPEGQVRLLSDGFHSARDPNVSFDGRRVLFAGRKAAADPWRVWEIGLDGSGLRAVTPESLDAGSPIHVSALFTLDSPAPWYTLVFVGRDRTLNQAGAADASSLYNIKLDGTELRRLTFNPDRNFDPCQTWDGRVIYSAARQPNQPGPGSRRVGLYAIHVEGADMELYGGEQGKRFQEMACATDRGLVVFVESDQPPADGAGQLACVELRRPHHSYRPLTRDSSVLYLHPSPLTDGRILVARRAANGRGASDIVCFDPTAGVAKPVFSHPDYACVQAVLALPRPSPDGHSTVVDTKSLTGLFYGLNCYDVEARLAPHVRTGMVKRVRLIEGVPPMAGQGSTTAPGPVVGRRLLGEAPVESDGSFNLEVPADIPLLLQTLDDQGMALATCGWIWVKPAEKRGCIGCHEDPERTPENEYVLALRRPSTRVVPPPAERRTLSFLNDVAPILTQHCATAECHGGHDTPLHLPLASAKPSPADLQAAYAALLAPAEPKLAKASAGPPAGKYVDAGRARTSWLMWQLLGRDTSRPWDVPVASAKGPPRKVNRMPPKDHGAPLDDEELRTLIQWIDMGAPYAPPAPLP